MNWCGRIRITDCHQQELSPDFFPLRHFSSQLAADQPNVQFPILIFWLFTISKVSYFSKQIGLSR
jgi:hypothetical protein